MSIHHTAILGKNVVLGKNITIDAYSIIEDNVVIGDNCHIASHVVIKNNVIMGANNIIYSFTTIGAEPQVTGHMPNKNITKLIIGSNNVIHESCSISRGTLALGTTVIGDNNLIMSNVHIGHDSIIGNNVVLASFVALGGHVTIFNHAVLGGGVLVHQFSTIGAYVMIAGNASISLDIAPFTIVHSTKNQIRGLNLRGMERNNFTQNEIKQIKNAYNILFRENRFYKEAVLLINNLALNNSCLLYFSYFFNKSNRSIARI